MRRIKNNLPLEGLRVEKRRADYSLLFGVIALTLIGLIMVYDASVVQALKDYGDKYAYVKQQGIWVVLGFLSLGFFSFFHYTNFKRLAIPMFLLSIILLLAVFVPGLGVSAGGAHRWLRIGGFTIQPAEIVKLCSVIFFASLFEKGNKLLSFIFFVSLITVIIGVFQRDLGSTIVFFLTSVSIYIISGSPLFYFLVGSPFILMGLMLFIFTSDYRRKRVLAFLDPFADPQGFSYHISQILIALGSGGWFGLGLGQSRQKFEYIPEVTTDSIFAIVGEEFGFIGGLILILLLSFIVYKGFKIAENMGDRFGRLLAFGLTMWIGTQTAINLAAMVSLIPLTGVPLPFISYGGSALLANLVAIGILLNISKYTKR